MENFFCKYEDAVSKTFVDLAIRQQLLFLAGIAALCLAVVNFCFSCFHGLLNQAGGGDLCTFFKYALDQKLA